MDNPLNNYSPQESTSTNPLNSWSLETPTRLPYAQERGTTMDILHDLWQGSGQALQLIGEGTGWQGMEDVGASIGQTAFARPDVSQYYGTQDRLGRVVDMIAQSAPLTLGIAGATALGAAAGPAGAAAAFTGAMGAVGKGTFDQSTEELRAADPNASEEDIFKYGLINSFSEVGSEGLGFLLPVGLGKMIGKGASKAAINKLIGSGRLSADQAISAVVKQVGAKESAKVLFGGAVADGASEVVNELIQSANRESVGLEREPVDLIDLALAGSAPGGAIAGGTLMFDAKAKSRLKGNIDAGLKSDSLALRTDTVGYISSALDNVGEGLGDAFTAKMTPEIAKGPVDIDELSRMEAEQETLDASIIETPEATLEDAGIPTKALVTPKYGTLRTEKRDVSGIGDGSYVEPTIVNEGPQVADPSIQAGIETEMAQRTSLRQEQAAVSKDVEDYMKVVAPTLDIPKKRIVKEDGTEEMVDGTIAEASVPLYDALILDNARSKAITSGMSRVSEIDNTLKTTTDLDEMDLLDREKAKITKQITKQVDNHVRETQGTKGIPKAEVTTDRTAVQQTKADAIGKVEKGTERPVTAQKSKTKASAPVKAKVEPKVEPKVDPKVKAEVDRAVAWSDKGVSAEDSVVLAKRGVPVTDGPIRVEEKRDEPDKKNSKGAFKSARYTDGSTIETGNAADGTGSKSNDKLFKVTKDGKVYRSSSETKAHKFITGEGPTLELWEDKVSETMLDKKREPLTDTQKDTVLSFIDKQKATILKKMTPAELKAAKWNAGTKTEAQIANMSPDELKAYEDTLSKAEMNLTDTVEMIRDSVARDLGDTGDYFTLAMNDVAATGKPITPGKIRDRMIALMKSEENKGEVSRKADAGVNVATVSAEEMFAKDEAKVGQAEDVSNVRLETEDKEVLDSGDTKNESIADATAYVQLDKKKYELQQKMLEPDGTIAESKKKASESARSILRTQDGRFTVLENPRAPGEVKSTVILIMDGEQAGIFNNPVEAMEAARDIDTETMVEPVPTPTNNAPKTVIRRKRKDTADMEASGIFGEKKVAYGNNARFRNGSALLANIANQSENKVSQALANMLTSIVPKSKLDAIPVHIGPVNMHRNGVVYLQKTAEAKSQLHELVHALTVREMENTQKFDRAVTELREKFKQHLIDKKILDSTKVEWLNKQQTSLDFESTKKDMDWGLSIKGHDAAYSVLNNNEFLAMAFANKNVQEMMKSVGGKKRTLWEQLKSFITEALGLDPKNTSMLDEVLTLGTEIAGAPVGNFMDQFADMEAQAPVTPINTDEAVREILKNKKGKKEQLKEDTLKQLKNIKNLAEFVAKPIADQVREYSDKLYASLMTMETNLTQDQTKYSKDVEPFLRWYKGLSISQRTRYDMALMNSQTSDNQKIIGEIPKAAYKSMTGVLGELRGRSENVGLGSTDKSFYFPRRVKDVVGLTNHLMKNGEYKGEIGEAFETEARRLGQPSLNEAQQAQVMTDMLQSGHFRQLPRPGSSNERSVPFVSPETYEFYSSSSEALIGHIFEMNEKVGQREFIGGSTRKTDIRELLKAHSDIEKMPAGIKKDKAIAEYELKALELEDLEADLEKRLGMILKDEMGDRPMEDQVKVRDLISSRLRQKGASGVIDAIRNVGYATTMGNFLSAITQFGDIPILLYRYGMTPESAKAVGTAFKNVKDIISAEMKGVPAPESALVVNADFQNVLREFTQGSTSGALVDKLFKYSGLKYTDLIGKEAFMQAGWAHFKKPENKQEFIDKYEPFFGENTETVLEEMKGKEPTRDVMTVLLTELSDFQPISLSQQSQGYLGGGNYRLLYMLKTFQLRASSAALREGMNEVKKGNYAKAAMRVTSIMLLYSIAGAGTDELKDLIRGRESAFTDNVKDKMLQMTMMNKYSLSKGIQSDKVFTSIMADQLPPFRWADSLAADLWGMISDEKDVKFKALNSLPLIGTIAYSQSSAGQTTYASMEKKDLMEEVKKNKEGKRGAYAGGLSRRISEYNKKVSRDEKITNDSVMRAYRSN